MALYLSDISCELREVSLKNKPPSMIKLSPKGTVPVMLLENGKVIDESIDIINWCLEQKFFLKINFLNQKLYILKAQLAYLIQLLNFILIDINIPQDTMMLMKVTIENAVLIS